MPDGMKKNQNELEILCGCICYEFRISKLVFMTGREHWISELRGLFCKIAWDESITNQYYLADFLDLYDVPWGYKIRTAANGKYEMIMDYRERADKIKKNYFKFSRLKTIPIYEPKYKH